MKGGAMVWAMACFLTASPAAAVVTDSSAADSSEAAVDSYLRGLEARTDETFPLRGFDLPPAEIDSLIREWQRGRPPPPPPVEPGWDLDLVIAAVRYNRVEGANVMPEATLVSPGRKVSAFALGGWGWAAGEPTWRAGLRGGPFQVQHSRDILSYGSGGLPGNTLTAFLAGKDWADYLRAVGTEVQVAARAGGLRLRLEASDLRHESLATKASFALFERDVSFRANPAVDEGRVRRVRAEVSRIGPVRGGLGASVSADLAGDALGGSFDYRRVRAETRWRRRMGRGDDLELALLAGIATEGAPFQELHHLGGTRTLRGFQINEVHALRFAHASLDYRIGTDLLQWIPFLRRFRLQPAPFADAAAVFRARDRDGTVRRIDPADVLFSVGVGVQRDFLGIPGGEGQIRVDVARRLDRATDATTVRVSFTLER